MPCFAELMPKNPLHFSTASYESGLFRKVLPPALLVFIFLLKGIIREILGPAAQETAVAEELAELESKIDAIALRAFDSFIKCREKIYELKANETKNMTYRLLQKAQMLCEIPGDEPGV